MGFFDRNRENLVKQGIDPARLPPGQYTTDRFPVLHVGDIPDYEPGQWDLTIHGLVATPLTIGFDELVAMPSVTPTFDIHCVTKWSKFDTTWTGVRVRDLFALAGVQPEATHVMEHAEFGYTTNIPLADITTDDAIIAYAFDGRADRGRTRRAGAGRRAAPVLLEVGEVGAFAGAHRRRLARVLGAERVPHVRRPVPRATLHQRLTIRSCVGARHQRTKLTGLCVSRRRPSGRGGTRSGPRRSPDRRRG